MISPNISPNISSLGSTEIEMRTGVLRERVLASIEVRNLLVDHEALGLAAAVAGECVQALSRGNTVFFFGNGGSSSDASHLAAELLGRFYRQRTPLSSLALADNTTAMTAISNDFSYDESFSRQLEGLGKQGDVAIGLSTSGNSANVIRALEVGQFIGMTTVVFTGSDGGKAASVADYVIKIPSDDTPRIQECHMLVGHTICELIEMEMFPAVE